MHKTFLSIGLLALLVGFGSPVFAQHRGGGHGGGARVSGGASRQAPPRVAPGVAGPHGVAAPWGDRVVAPVHFYRPYYAFRPRVSVGFGLWMGLSIAYPYAYYSPFYWYGYGYPYASAAYGYGYPYANIPTGTVVVRTHICAVRVRSIVPILTVRLFLPGDGRSGLSIGVDSIRLQPIDPLRGRNQNRRGRSTCSRAQRRREA